MNFVKKLTSTGLKSLRLLNFLQVLCLMMLTPSIVYANTIMIENFEDSNFNFTVSDTLFHDGAGDYYTVIPLTFSGNMLGSPAEAVTAYTGFGGNNFFAAEYVDDGGLRPDTRTMSFNVNISGYSNLAFSTLFAAGGNGAATPAYDANDGFLIRASIDGGAFQNLLAFEAAGVTNQLLRQDTDFNGVGDGFLPSAAFTAFNNLAISGTGKNLLLEIILTSNDGNVEFAFDDVTITGNVSAVPEPETYGMMLLGLGLLGFVTRRKQA